jgi:hypothetical protein
MKTNFNPPFDCLLCGKKLNTNKSRSQHLIKKHNIQPKDYYDQHIKTKEEGHCLTCKGDIQWKAGKGYHRFCSASCAMQNIEIQKKINNIETNNQRSNNYKNKTKEDILIENKKREETNLIKYGVIYPMKNNIIKNKRIINTLKKYGVKHTSMLKEVQEKRLSHQPDFFIGKPYILPSNKIIYVLGYENNFLDYVFQNKLINEEDFDFKKRAFKYQDCNQIKHYYPDFYIPKFDLFIEIKSTYVMQRLQGINNCLLKENSVKESGHNYILILDNNFKEFEEYIKILSQGKI